MSHSLIDIWSVPGGSEAKGSVGKFLVVVLSMGTIWCRMKGVNNIRECGDLYNIHNYLVPWGGVYRRSINGKFMEELDINVWE